MNSIKSLLLAASLMSVPLMQASQGNPRNPGPDASQGSPSRFLGVWGIRHTLSNKKIVGGCLLGAGVLYGAQRYSSTFRNKISKPAVGHGKRYLNNLYAGDRKTLAYTGAAAALGAGIYFRKEIGSGLSSLGARKIQPDPKSTEEIAREAQEAAQAPHAEAKNRRLDYTELLNKTRELLVANAEKINQQQRVVNYQELVGGYTNEQRAEAQSSLTALEDECRQARDLEADLVSSLSLLDKAEAVLKASQSSDNAVYTFDEEAHQETLRILEAWSNKKIELEEAIRRQKAYITELMFSSLNLAALREAEGELARLENSYVGFETQERELLAFLESQQGE